MFSMLRVAGRFEALLVPSSKIRVTFAHSGTDGVFLVVDDEHIHCGESRPSAVRKQLSRCAKRKHWKNRAIEQWCTRI